MNRTKKRMVSKFLFIFFGVSLILTTSFDSHFLAHAGLGSSKPLAPLIVPASIVGVSLLAAKAAYNNYSQSSSSGRHGLSNPSAHARNICEEENEDTPPKKVARFHLNWIGAPLPDDPLDNQSRSKYLNNIKRLCDDINKNRKNRERYEIYLWGNDNNFKDHVATITAACPNISILQRDSSSLFVNESAEVNPAPTSYESMHSLYNFYLERKMYAGASDIIRPLMLQKFGGCYLDLGFKIAADKSLVAALNVENDEQDIYVYGSAPPARLDIPALFNDGRNSPPVDSDFQATFNGFMAARKHSPALVSILEDFKARIQIFQQMPILSDFYLNHCNKGEVVFSLVGQGAFNQSLYTFKEGKGKVGYIPLTSIIPYNGGMSWHSALLGKGCEAELFCLKERLISLYPSVKDFFYQRDFRSQPSFHYSQGATINNIFVELFLIELNRQNGARPINPISSGEISKALNYIKAFSRQHPLTTEEAKKVCSENSRSSGVNSFSRLNSLVQQMGPSTTDCSEKCEATMISNSLVHRVDYDDLMDNRFFERTETNKLHRGDQFLGHFIECKCGSRVFNVQLPISTECKME